MRSRKSAIKCQACGPEPRVVGHHEHFGKESIDGGAQAGNLHEGGPVVAAADRGFDVRAAGVECGQERTLGRFDERITIHCCRGRRQRLRLP